MIRKMLDPHCLYLSKAKTTDFTPLTAINRCSYKIVIGSRWGAPNQMATWIDKNALNFVNHIFSYQQRHFSMKK